MAIDNDLAVTVREAAMLYAAPSHVESDVVVETAVDDGVSLTLSAQGRLMAAVMVAADMTGNAAEVDLAEARDAAASVVPAPAKPITRATLLAIEARLAAGRGSAGAVEQADREVPPSADPQRLRQAEQATQSLYGRASNPFAGMSRVALSDIVYDESGAYTVNERYAAAAQRAEIDRTYWTPLFQRAQASGDWRAVIEAGIAFYNNLSPLEQTAYPANYLQLMQQYLVLANVQPATPAAPDTASQSDLWLLLTNLILPTGRLSAPAGLLNRYPSSAENVAATTRTVVQPLANESPKVDGYLLLLQRVFGILRRADEPQIATRATLSAQNRDFLSAADRRFLARAYGYAAVNGIALDEVDGLAGDLAGYRFTRAAGGDPESKPGALWNADGTPRYYRMDDENTALAQRMLTSRAARETELDHGFLSYLLNPRGGGWMSANARGHAISLPILDQLLNGLMRLRGGVASDESQVSDGDIEPAYRYALARLSEQDIPDLPPGSSADNSVGARILAMAAQLAAMVRSDAFEMAQYANALSMLRLYRYALKMNEGDQRLLSELVHGSMRWRRMQKRRMLPVPRLHWLQR